MSGHCWALQEYGARLDRNNPAYFFPGSNIHGTNSLGRESNMRRNNK